MGFGLMRDSFRRQFCRIIDTSSLFDSIRGEHPHASSTASPQAAMQLQQRGRQDRRAKIP
jgi:hypothetical protein